MIAPANATLPSQAKELRILLICELTALSIGAVLVLAWMYGTYIAGCWLPHWDESTYHLTGLRIWRDLTSGDVVGLFRDTMKQRFVPFVTSYFLSFFMLFGGPELESSRFASLVAGLFGWGFAVALASAITNTRKLEAAIFSGVFLLLSPGFFYYSSLALTESLVLAEGTLCLLATVQFQKTGSRLAAVATGGLIAIAFLTKYNAGVTLGAVVVLTTAIPALWERRSTQVESLRRVLSNSWFLAFSAAALPIAAWLAAPGLRDVYYYLRTHGQVPLTQLEHATFVPVVFFRDFSVHPFFAIVVGLALAYWLVVGWKDNATRIPLAWVTILLVGITIHPTKEPRYLAPTMGCLAALTGCFLARFLDSKRPRSIAALTFASILLPAMFFPAMVSALADLDRRIDIAAAPAQKAAIGRIVSFLRSEGKLGRPLLVNGYFTNPLLFVHQLWKPQTNSEPRIEALPHRGPPGPSFTADFSEAYRTELNRYVRSNPDAILIAIQVEEHSSFRSRTFRWCCEWQQNYSTVLRQSPLVEAMASVDAGEGIHVYSFRLRNSQLSSSEPSRGSSVPMGTYQPRRTSRTQ